jgi:uncharacterized protein
MAAHSPGRTLVSNPVIHFEVVGKDGPALQRFYHDLFGWTVDTNNPGGYGMVRDAGDITGGVGAAPDGSAGHVTFYVHTEDPQAVLRSVESLGGRVIMPLTELAPETTVALFADPEGHIVGLM